MKRSSIHEKVKQHWGWAEFKTVAYKKSAQFGKIIFEEVFQKFSGEYFFIDQMNVLLGCCDLGKNISLE